MSYKNQKILTITNPVGIDKTIASLQQSLSNLAYLDKIFGRARINNTTLPGGKQDVIPLVYSGGKEYENVLPNDNYKAMVFFVTNGSSEPIDYLPNQSNTYERGLSLIFWGNLNKINSSLDYVFTERIVGDLLKAVSTNPYVVKVESVIDDKFDDVFKEFKLSHLFADNNTKFLMYPFAGIRIDLVVSYRDGFDCNAPSADQ